MPYDVQQLLGGLGEPVIAQHDEPISAALERMVEHGFSQLPVIKQNGDNKQYFLLTSERALQSLYNFGTKLNDPRMLVADALVPVSRTYQAEESLFDLLTGIRDYGAALVVDAGKNLKHIVTSYDTTLYFRQWSEDIMQAREVESIIKKLIRGAFKRSDGSVDDAKLQGAIEATDHLRKNFRSALQRYLSESLAEVTVNKGWAAKAYLKMRGETGVRPETDGGSPLDETNPQQERFEEALQEYLQHFKKGLLRLDEKMVENAFKCIEQKEGPKDLEEVTLANYITLFFADECWGRCERVFNKSKTDAAHLLDEVRKTRNKLAHFKEHEINALQRQQLRMCAEWLYEHYKDALDAFDETAPPAPLPEDPLADPTAAGVYHSEHVRTPGA